MDTTSQNQYLYNHMMAGKSITNLDAVMHHHIGRLASRISDLINEYGVPVQKVREPNSDGKGFHTRYSIAENMREALKDVPLYGVYKRIAQLTPAHV